MFDQLIQDFWTDVERRLVEVYQTPRAQAQESILQYRERLGAHGVTTMLYHAGPDNIADAIHKGGYKAPPPELAL